MPTDSFELIKTYTEVYSEYHHHKENMAFGAATLYLIGATTAVFLPTDTWSSIAPQGFFFFVLGTTALSVFLFVFWQFRMREFAFDIVIAAEELSTRWKHKDPDDSKEQEQTPFRHRKLPKALVDLIQKNVGEKGLLTGPRPSEYLTYFVMLLWTLMAILRICSSLWINRVAGG